MENLKLLFKCENEALLKLSKLNEIGMAPKLIERQNVNICLRVFCSETIAAFESHPKLNWDDMKGTANFLKIVVEM